LIVGEGPLRPSLEQLSQELGLARCRFTGFREDIPNLLWLMDVFALPSILEGLPQVLLEALAAARPVVATRIDGITEVVQHGTTGLLVPPQDPTALADAIILLLKDQGLARRLGEAGRKLVEDRFALSRMIEKVDRFYMTLLQKKGLG
ncbi:MAG: glycosyltransferase, partial [Candidatus Methylomirabilales bacterium]